MTVSWIQAGIALIKVLSAIIAWMERQSAERAGFNKAIALEMQAAARARARVAGIEKVVRELSDEELARKLAATRRTPQRV